MITVNLRATATAARLKPILSRSLRPLCVGCFRLNSACRDDRRSFVEKLPQVWIPSPGYMAVIIDFSRLVSAGCQADLD